MKQSRNTKRFSTWVIIITVLMITPVYSESFDSEKKEMPDDLTPMETAIDSGNIETVRSLIDSGTDINSPSKHPSGFTPLHRAVIKGNVPIVELLLNHGADTEARDAVSGTTPLYWASGLDELQIVEKLIQHGAAVDALDTMGETPLFHAASRDKPKNARMLISKGADIHRHATHPGTGRCTALHSAAMFGSVGVLNVLLEQGADPDVRTDTGCTPLHWAATNGQYDTAMELLKH
ncbi:MAG TPA: ankyrin repeat domain-containing protein, partial [bacterium]|nr:ankyrin repeat domain-containing protein [bacterium]